MAISPTTHWEAQQLPPENVARLLVLLFAPEGDAAQEPEYTDEPTCGFEAACERFDRHLAWFEEDARAGVA